MLSSSGAVLIAMAAAFPALAAPTSVSPHTRRESNDESGALVCARGLTLGGNPCGYGTVENPIRLPTTLFTSRDEQKARKR